MGYFRFFLCLPIVITHLKHFMLAGPIAVLTLFMLAGFLTARVTHETYAHGLKAKGYFLANRFLRLYPTYLACLILSYFLVRHSQPNDFWMFWKLSIPHTALDWLKQFTIVGLSNFTPQPTSNTLLVPAWSLSTEIFYYVLIGVALGGKRTAINYAFVITAALTVTTIVVSFGSLALYPFLYFSIEGPAVIFLFGAWCYHHQDRISRYLISNRWVALLLANFVLYAADWYYQTQSIFTIEGASQAFGSVENAKVIAIFLLYAPLIPFAWIIISLNKLPFKSGSVDELCADISYPIFLIHCTIGYYLHCRYPDFETFSPLFFGISLFYSILVSAMFIILIERPMKKYRKLVRMKAA